MTLSTIDHLTRYGELFPNSRKLNDEEILQQPIVLNLDNGQYIPLSDANPMIQTIMERTHRAESIANLRHNTLKKSLSSLRRSSSENNSFSISDINLSHKRHKKHGGDDNESTSSGSSSTKSSHTTGISSSSTTSKSLASSSSRPSIKKQLKNLVVKNFFRKKKHEAPVDHQHAIDIDEEEDDTERLLINDGSNGDLKYKASRHLKEQTQFDKTQLLQTIVNAHSGPIWCMK